jgi:hypothetical protein
MFVASLDMFNGKFGHVLGIFWDAFGKFGHVLGMFLASLGMSKN